MRIVYIVMCLILLSACTNNNTEQNSIHTTSGNKEVNVYTQRHYDSDDSLYLQFTDQTGIKVNVIKAKADELINKLILEEKNSPADLLITVDAERLMRAKEKNLLQPILSDSLVNIPQSLKDSLGYWVALTYRARILACAKDISKDKLPQSYAELAEKKWKGNVLVRSSESGYNQSLLASIIYNTNENTAREWSKGIVENMAREPKGNDRDQMKAVAAGIGQVAIVNSYYLALMVNSNDHAERDVANKLQVVFPNQNERGAHVNISGIALTASSPNKGNAIKLIEFLLSKQAQVYLTKVNCEYPANKNIEPTELLKSWGSFKADFGALPNLEKNHIKAMMIFNETGWK